MQAHHGAESFHQPRLAQPRQADQQAMATTQKRGQRQFHHTVLTDETVGDGFLGFSELFAQCFDLGHHVFGLGHDKNFLGIIEL